MRKLLILLPLLTACTTSAGVPTLPPKLQSDVVSDFQAAQANFQAVGMTAEAQCMADVVAKIQGPAGVTLQVKGLASLGSVAYINFDQVQKLISQGPNSVSASCQQIVGKVIISINQANLRALGGAAFGAIIAPK